MTYSKKHYVYEKVDFADINVCGWPIFLIKCRDKFSQKVPKTMKPWKFFSLK